MLRGTFLPQELQQLYAFMDGSYNRIHVNPRDSAISYHINDSGYAKFQFPYRIRTGTGYIYKDIRFQETLEKPMQMPITNGAKSDLAEDTDENSGIHLPSNTNSISVLQLARSWIDSLCILQDSEDD